MSDAIFIVGYYRSGTSALSGALQRLGVKFFNEADPNEHNPLGFYEIPELIEFDVDLFNRLGVEWTDVRGLPDGWWARADIAGYLTRLDEILRRRFPESGPLWGLKHPHLCRTLPLYAQAARQAGHTVHVVHIFRDPFIAAASQQHKNGLSRAHALLLWLRYVTDAERHARHLPRSWLTYQDLLTQPAAQLAQIERDTGLQLSSLTPGGPRAAADYLTAQLNRSRPLPRETLAKPLQALVGHTWERIVARDFSPATWEHINAETTELVDFLSEIGASRGRVIPSFGGTLAQEIRPGGQAAQLRPAERVDEGGRLRLLALAAAAPLPRLAVVIVAPPGRAPALNETLASLRAQWQGPARITILASDAFATPEHQIRLAGAEPGEISAMLCTILNEQAAAVGTDAVDYVAVLNAGDTLSPDACLRFALAAQSHPPMLYCDEIVPNDAGAWVRHKPGWDITRLRQSAYLGDWVWYHAATLTRLGGFNAEYGGAEEYELQLRIAELGIPASRLPEALFTRSAGSRRDAIPAHEFCTRAAQAVAAHLARIGAPAQVQNRQHLGLFHHLRTQPDPGTSTILLVDDATVADLERWTTALLSTDLLSGPIILAGTALSEPMIKYLTAVRAQRESLAGKVLAVPPRPMPPGAALAGALALVPTPLVAVLDARAEPLTQHWAAELRTRLADPDVGMVSARGLVPLEGGKKQFSIQGPLVIGADTRLGAGHLADDPGPGGWLIVDQEASALAPPALLARTQALRDCAIPELEGDALWLELGAQLRQAGTRLVWTPDVSFIIPAVTPQNSPVSPGEPDPYHHPALSLRGDLLAAEQRLGLVRAAPDDPKTLLLSGAAQDGGVVLNTARALRRTGTLEADWSPEPLTAGELGRRAPAAWVRVNPQGPPAPLSPPSRAVFCAPPGPQAASAIAAASAIFASSPELLKMLHPMARPDQPLLLWRPTISARIWQDFKPVSGLNTRPRVLWVDEGIAPGWLPDLINETQHSVAWIVVERPNSVYSGGVARITQPGTEQAWADALAELAPQILIRPAADISADHGIALMAAAAGCHLLVDARLDLPDELGATCPAPTQAAWRRRLDRAVLELGATLAQGALARTAALARPGTEAAPPPWAKIPEPRQALRSAAE